MRNFAFIMTLLMTRVTSAQDYEFGYILAKPSLNLRSDPAIDAMAIATIPHATKVKVFLVGGNHIDTLNNAINKWNLIEHKGERGYVWGKYITYNENLVSEYGLLSVGQDGANYNPRLNWYGIFEGDIKGQNQIKRVDISLIDISNEYYGLLSNVVKINLEEMPLFLFGTNKEIKRGLIPGNSLRAKYDKEDSQEDFERKLHESFLYPEELMKLKLESSKHQLEIKAKDAPYIDSTHNFLYTRYELEVTNKSFYSTDSNVQNITNEIPFIDAPASTCVIYKNPSIVWYGDLDFDQKIDFMISSTTMVDSDAVETSIVLFLSSEAERGTICENGCDNL